MPDSKLKLRNRHIAHAWWDKRVFRFIGKYFSGKEKIYLTYTYTILCQIDSDFCEREDNPDKGLKGIVQTCATYSGMDKRTTSKYMSALRNLLLIDYGQEREEETGVLGRSFLKMYLFDENIHNIDIVRSRGRHIPTTGKFTVVGTHRLRSDVPHKNNTKVLKSDKNESIDSIDEPLGSSVRLDSRINEKPLRLTIKRKRSSNGDGTIFDSGKKKKPNSIDLNKWLDHKLNRNADYEKPIIDLQTKLYSKRIVPNASEIKEVLSYWNKVATEMSNNGHRFTRHKVTDSKVIYMCQIIITGILHTTEHTVEDIKKAIDNYMWILENSPWFNTLYPSFPRFFGTKNLFKNCIADDVKNNKSYVNLTYKPKELKGKILEEEVRRFHRKAHGRDPDRVEWCSFYKPLIDSGEVKTVDDFYKFE